MDVLRIWSKKRPPTGAVVKKRFNKLGRKYFLLEQGFDEGDGFARGFDAQFAREQFLKFAVVEVNLATLAALGEARDQQAMHVLAERIDLERLLVHFDRLAQIAAGARALAEGDQRFEIILVEH